MQSAKRLVKHTIVRMHAWLWLCDEATVLTVGDVAVVLLQGVGITRREANTSNTLADAVCRLAMAEAPPNGDNVENRRSPWPTKAELTNADSVETRLPPVSASPLSEIEGRRLTSLNRVAAAAKACESLEFFLKLALRKDPVIAVSKACASLEPLRKLGLRAHVWGGLYTHVRCLSLKLLVNSFASAEAPGLYWLT